MAEKSRYIREGSPDIFRDIARIAGMIIVNIPGSGEYLFGSQNHLPQYDRKWSDLISPFFAALDYKALTAYILSMILFIFILLPWFGLVSIGSSLMHPSTIEGFEHYFTSFVTAAFYCILCSVPGSILYKKPILIKI